MHKAKHQVSRDQEAKKTSAKQTRTAGLQALSPTSASGGKAKTVTTKVKVSTEGAKNKTRESSNDRTGSLLPTLKDQSASSRTRIPKTSPITPDKTSTSEAAGSSSRVRKPVRTKEMVKSPVSTKPERRPSIEEIRRRGEISKAASKGITKTICEKFDQASANLVNGLESKDNSVKHVSHLAENKSFTTARSRLPVTSPNRKKSEDFLEVQSPTEPTQPSESPDKGTTSSRQLYKRNNQDEAGSPPKQTSSSRISDYKYKKKEPVDLPSSASKLPTLGQKISKTKLTKVPATLPLSPTSKQKNSLVKEDDTLKGDVEKDNNSNLLLSKTVTLIDDTTGNEQGEKNEMQLQDSRTQSEKEEILSTEKSNKNALMDGSGSVSEDKLHSDDKKPRQIQKNLDSLTLSSHKDEMDMGAKPVVHNKSHSDNKPDQEVSLSNTSSPQATKEMEKDLIACPANAQQLLKDQALAPKQALSSDSVKSDSLEKVLRTLA
ncbi:hypothetical protein WMY93_017098 [Mugilogobius chulae]|uniref:Uncharacterized protein n=1 Tax=Mugilogobius chulae TaxID=88201 RepID=A0AAW0NUB2_9GOBI